MTGTELFDDQLLQAFIDGFYGYGSYAGDYWFIGMEEGGGNSFAGIAQRLNDWDRRGRKELEDIADYHAEIGETRYFGDRPKLQATWKKLIRVLLTAEGQNPQVEDVRTYQQQRLGRHSSNNCLLELMPLPSPSTGHWLYAKHSRITDLANRKMYMQRYAPCRADYIKQRIEQYGPKAVVFYSSDKGYAWWWERIAGVPFAQAATGELQIGSNAKTAFIIMRHPTAPKTDNAYCHAVATAIATKVAELRP